MKDTSNKAKILFFGPYSGPIMGQSLAFNEVYDNYLETKILINTTKFGSYKLLNTLYCLFWLPIIFITKKFDKVYFTCTRSKMGFIKDFQLLLLCKIYNKKVINHLHGADFNFFLNSNTKLFKLIIKWSYKKINVSIVLLPSMKEEFIEFPKMKIAVVNNCYSTIYQDIEIDVDSKKKQILYLSNLMESKGILIFLDSLGQILKYNSKITVKIAGEFMSDVFSSKKEIQHKFQQKFQKLSKNFPERISYLGRITGDLKKEILSESSIFVLPTFYATEAFPIAIIEAMRFGNAIIATNHNYLKDIVSKQNGFLIRKKSIIDLYEKVNSLLNDNLRLKTIQQHNIKIAKEKYNPQLYNKRIYNIITEL